MSHTAKTLKSWNFIPLSKWEEACLVRVGTVVWYAILRSTTKLPSESEFVEGMDLSLIGSIVWRHLMKKHGGWINHALERVLRRSMAQYMLENYLPAIRNAGATGGQL